MADTSTRWTDSLQFSSLFWPPPLDTQQRKEQITAYVDYFGQFTSEQFPEDIAELVRHRYPSQEKRLFDDVLATFVLHHPEHGHSVILPIISCIIDGTMEYDRSTPPFASFISLVCPSTDKEYSEQWALACGEILRVLTHYNRPILKADHQHKVTDRSISGSQASTSNSPDSETSSPSAQNENKPLRLLSPWITDILLAAPLGIRSDYFRWCGGVMGKYAAGELKPPSVVMASRGSGKHPQLVPSTPRWAVANGAGVILSHNLNIVPRPKLQLLLSFRRRELQPWIAKDDDLGQKMWRINQRIVKLIVELMRNHNTPESLVIMSSALDLLLRATDGMLVDGEACTLPQLELLEATARAVQPVLEWGESGIAVADGLSNLLKCRLPATVRCLSHPSAHVRTLSTSVLRAILHVGLVNPIGAAPNIPAACGPAYQYLNVDVTDWESDVGKCLTWEAHSRIATGMPIQYLNTAAKELGCPISI